MNKIWNSESNSMMIEWKKWIVNDQCVIDDNNEEYGIDGMESVHQQMKVMIEWILHSNNMIHNRLTVDCDVLLFIINMKRMICLMNDLNIWCKY